MIKIIESIRKYIKYNDNIGCSKEDLIFVIIKEIKLL